VAKERSNGSCGWKALKLFKESRNMWGKRALCARKLVPLHPQIAKITFLIN
jgi:hypothetical protein